MSIVDLIKKQIKKSEIKELFKGYTEGIYADTHANRKLGRVGMSYKAWEELQRSLEDKKMMDANHPEYKHVSPIQEALKDLDAHHQKTIKLKNGNKILCRYDSYHQHYSAVIVSDKYVTKETITSRTKRDFVVNLNKYLNKEKTEVGEPPKKVVKSFTRPTDRIISEEEQQKIDNYWDKNRSNYALSNLLNGDGTYGYKDYRSPRMKSTAAAWVDSNIPYITEGETFFEDRRRFYNDFEDCTLEQFDKALKDAMPEGMSKADQKEFEESLIFGNLLRSQGDDLYFHCEDIPNRYLNPSTSGKRFLTSIDTELVKENGKFVGLKVNVEILDRKEFTYKKMDSYSFEVKGKTLKELGDNYFKVVADVLKNAQNQFRAKPDTPFYSSADNNIFRKGDRYFYEGWTPDQIGKRKEK